VLIVTAKVTSGVGTGFPVSISSYAVNHYFSTPRVMV
jgi:hypothetical protein